MLWGVAAEKRRQQKAEGGPAPNKTPKKKAKAKASVKNEFQTVKIEKNPLEGLTADELGDEMEFQDSMTDGEMEDQDHHENMSYF